jgi:hypothetical protein
LPGSFCLTCQHLGVDDAIAGQTMMIKPQQSDNGANTLEEISSWLKRGGRGPHDAADQNQKQRVDQMP